MAAPNEKNKTITRILVVLLMVGILGVIIALIVIKNNSPENNGEIETNSETGEKTADPEKNGGSENSIMVAASPVTIYTEDVASIPNLLFPYLQKPFDADGYYRIIIQNKKDNTIVGLRQFMNIYKIAARPDFYNSTSDDFTLFIYSSKGKNRLGFVAKTANSEYLETEMANWESSMVKDTDGLFKLLGRKTQNSTTPLKFDSRTTPGNNRYRSLVFAPASDNFSISYAIHNGKYFIFATSNEALINIFGQLPK